MIVRSERLDLRPWSASDAGLLGELARHPDVTRQIGDGAVWPEDRIAERARMIAEHWAQHGFGWRTIAVRETGGDVGFVVLSYAGEGTEGVAADEVEIGWWLHPSAWGRGYAGEAAAAVRDEAFGRLGAPVLVARIQAANAASIAVARRLGMRHEFDSVGRFGEALQVWRAYPA